MQGASVLSSQKNPADGGCESTVSPWDTSSTEKNVRGGRVVKVELKIENCVFANENSPLSKVDYGFYISSYGNGFCP